MGDVLDLGVAHDDAMGIVEDEAQDVEMVKTRAKKRKGRGFDAASSHREVINNYEAISSSKGENVDAIAQRSVEGYILIVTGVHEEAHEDDVQGLFSEHGEIKNLHLNLDRRTGFLKGYALIEYDSYKQAAEAKLKLDGQTLLGQTIRVDWAFMKKPIRRTRR